MEWYKILNDLGVSPHVRGYEYLKVALEIAYENSDNFLITKHIYPEVAKRFNSTESRVDRAIRYAIETAIIDSPKFRELFPFKWTSSFVIARLLNMRKMQCLEE